MVKKLILSITCALLSLSSWADNNDKNVRVIKLTGQEIKVDSSNPRRYPRFIFGDILISTTDEFYGDNIKDNEWVEGEVIPKIGSCDGMIMPHLAKGPDNSLIRVEVSSSGALQKMIIVPNTSSISAFKDESTWKTFDLHGLPNLDYFNNGVAILSDSTMLIPAFINKKTKNIFAIVDFKNKKFIPLDYWPNDGIDSVSNNVKSSFYTMNCELETNGKGRFFYKACYSNNAFVFAIDNDKVNIVKHLHVDHPKYYTPDGNNFQTENYLTERIESATNSQYIALILQDADKSGAKISKRKISRPFYFGNTVELYDWDGNKKHTLYLDHYGQRIFLSDDSKKLYLTWCDEMTGENSQIWVYDLTNLDKQPQAELAELEKNRIVKEEEQEPQEDNLTGIGPLKEGEMMADFELYDYDDRPHHLNEFLGKGKYTILEFSSIGCGPCQLAKPTLEKFYEKYKDRFEMITISSDKEKAWKQKPHGEVSWHEWNDHKQGREIGRKYGITGEPTFIFISSEGQVERICPALGGFFNALNDYISTEELDELKKFFVENVKTVMGR
jgi:thiol-disulfide isomerase/thioredoxin